MIGTICFIADFDTENYLNEFKIQASERFHVGVMGGNVPRHISLGMPYEVPDWAEYVRFVEAFSKNLKPVCVSIEDMVTACFPRPDTGGFFLRFKENFGLDSIRKALAESIRQELGVVIGESLIGKRVIALGCGTRGIEAYNDYVASLDPSSYVGKTLRFDQIGVFYYPEANWDPSRYMCYRRIRLV